MRTFLLLLLCSTVAQAFEFPSNPDRFQSIYVELFKAQQAGIAKAGVDGAQTNGGLVGFGGRYKVPVSGAVTIHSFAETAGINNNHQFTDGYKLGVGFQLYMK
jgi:hypothetical protein